jgi:hypothetical protein
MKQYIIIIPIGGRAVEVFNFDIPKFQTLELFLKTEFPEILYQNCILLDTKNNWYANSNETIFKTIQMHTIKEMP